MDVQEPYPLVVVSPAADVVRQNRAVPRLFSRFIVEPAALGEVLNLFSLVFDPRLMRPFFATVTSFSLPRLVTLEELRIESAFPLDDATRRFCELAAAAEP